MKEPRIPAIRLNMLPKDTNHLGSIFGGHILSLIDLAAGTHARTESPKRFVTKVMREVEFLAPVYVGDMVSFYTSTQKIGKSSITIKVEVEALRGLDMLTTHQVTTAEVIMVAVDENFKPVAIKG